MLKAFPEPCAIFLCKIGVNFWRSALRAHTDNASNHVVQLRPDDFILYNLAGLIAQQI